MASGPHDPRSQEWPADDDDVYDDATHEGESQEPHTSPPTIQHFPPGPSDDSTRGLPLSSPWMLPPFAAPTPDDSEPPQARPEGLGGERRRPHTQPYAPAPPPAAPPFPPDPHHAAADQRPVDERSPEPGRHAPQGQEQGQGRPRLVDRPDLLVASGPARERRGPGRANRPDLLVASGPSGEEHRRAEPPPPPPPPDPRTGSGWSRISRRLPNRRPNRSRGRCPNGPRSRSPNGPRNRSSSRIRTTSSRSAAWDVLPAAGRPGPICWSPRARPAGGGRTAGATIVRPPRPPPCAVPARPGAGVAGACSYRSSWSSS